MATLALWAIVANLPTPVRHLSEQERLQAATAEITTVYRDADLPALRRSWRSQMEAPGTGHAHAVTAAWVDDQTLKAVFEVFGVEDTCVVAVVEGPAPNSVKLSDGRCDAF
jgi:hypothetical protein